MYPETVASEFESMQQLWEEAANELTSAASKYLDTISKLYNTSDFLSPHPPRQDLIHRIDNHLDKLSALDFVAPLKRLRNKCTDSTEKLPVEILTEIFRHDIDETRHLDIYSRDRLDSYKCILRLTGICHKWRDIMLGASSFWSFISLCEQDCYQPDNGLVRLWLERSAGASLYVVIDFPRFKTIKIIPLLQENINRVRSLRMRTGTPESTRAILACWLTHGTPGSNTELSISQDGKHGGIVPVNTSNQSTLDSFLRPLQKLQLQSLYFPWNSVAYQGLTELRLEQIGRFYSENVVKMADLMRVLSASPGLNTLALVRIDIDTSQGVRLLPITLAHLRTFYAEACSHNTVEPILSLIAPGSYAVHLRLPSDHSEHQIDYTNTSPFLSLLRKFNIVSLSLRAAYKPDNLHSLLWSLPHLRALYLNTFKLRLNSATMWAIMRVPNVESPETGYPFPSLRAIYIFSGEIMDQEGFKTMVSSHPMEKLILGGWIRSHRSNGLFDLKPTDNLFVWASNRVSDCLCFLPQGRPTTTPSLDPFSWGKW